MAYSGNAYGAPAYGQRKYGAAEYGVFDDDPIRPQFADGTPGLDFDFTDLSMMRQNSAGTTAMPVPGSGVADPPIGLIFDKSKGMALGPELVTNGGFDSDNGWSKSQPTSGIVVISGGVLRINSADNSYCAVSQESVFVVGKCYVVEFNVVSISGSIRVRPISQSPYEVITSVGKKTIYYVAIGTALYIERQTACDAVIDNISVREVLGNHATQSTDAKRPVLSGRYNRIVATEDLSAVTWTKSSTTVESGQLAPDGTFTATRLTCGATGSMFTATTLGITTGDKKSIWARAVSGTGTVAILGYNSYSKYQVTLTETWQLFEAVVDTTETGGTFFYAIDARYGTLKDILVWHPDLRSANLPASLPSYQAVVAANTYDTAGFPLRPVFNGVTQFLKVESLDMSSTDAVTVFAGVRKLRDATTGIVVELSEAPVEQDGWFGLLAPSSSGINSYRFRSKGTNLVNAGAGTFAEAPDSAVLTGLADISVDFVS